MIAEIRHASLGTIQGVEVDGVCKYLGLKYASLSGRFSESQLVTEYPGEKTDATQVG